MSKYIKLEDAIRVIENACGCECYGEVTDIIQNLPTIEVSEDAINTYRDIDISNLNFGEPITTKEALADVRPRKDVADLITALEKAKETKGKEVAYSKEVSEMTAEDAKVVFGEEHSVDAPDMVEVVRCKDCRWSKDMTDGKRNHLFCGIVECLFADDDYCSCGEVRT